jgi:heme exporter protein A
MTAPSASEPSLTAASLAATDLACLRGGRLVFAGLSFRLDPSEALVLTGPNGSGKSSLLRLVAGLVPAFAGRLDRTGAPGSIAYLGHQDAVKPALTVREALRIWAAMAGVAAGEGAVGAAIAAVGLEGLDDLPGRYLSAGQRRRLALARLELGRAALWLLDEPTLGLDAASVARLEGRIARHRAAGGLVMLATHVPLALDDARGLALQDYAAEDLPL